MNGESQNFGPKKKNYWIIAIAVISIWIILGGLYFWTENKKDQPQESYFEPITEQPAEQPTTTEEPSTGGHLTPAGEREEETGELPETFLGYIKKIENKFDNYYLKIDYVEWVVGDEAKEAALEAGECKILEDCAPNGFYIRNESKLVRTYQTTDNVDIRMQTFSTDDQDRFNVDEQITMEQFVDIFNPYSENHHLAEVPYRVEVKDGKIIKIWEKYIP